MRIDVQPRGRTATPRTAHLRQAMTAVVRDTVTATYTAPRRADGITRGECWGATSRDGLWRFERVDDVTSPWRVTYLPTGQQVDGDCGTLNRARAATADPATLTALRQAAYTAALGPAPTAEGARWLAVHMRLAGADQADSRCRCGGLLTVVTRDGRLGHVDACDACTTIGEAGITHCTRQHTFCATPRRSR